MSNPLDTGNFDQWITNRTQFNTIHGRSGNNGDFEKWITNHNYFEDYVSFPTAEEAEAFSIALDTLILLSSVQSMSVSPAAVSLLLNTLTLNGSLETINIALGASYILLGTLPVFISAQMIDVLVDEIEEINKYTQWQVI
jgi:hypothetical protein